MLKEMVKTHNIGEW